MSPEEEKYPFMAIGALRVLMKRPYITADVAALIQGEIDELQQEVREASAEAAVAEPTNDLEAASFGLRPANGDDS